MFKFGTVGFDPGHHARCNAGPGTYREGDVMLTLGNALREKYRVFATRTDGNAVDYYDRAKKAKVAGCNTFISLHTNAPIEAKGIIIFYSLQRPGDKELAEYIGQEIAKATGLKFREAKTRQYPNKPGVDYYAVIRHAVSLGIEHPIIIEHGSHWEFAEDTESKIKNIVECYGRILGLEKKMEAKYYVHNNNPYPTVKKGDRSITVKYLQTELRYAGFDCGVPDGVFGANTDKQVKLYQKACGLVADGIVGAKTWAALLQIHIVELDAGMLKASLVSSSGPEIAESNFINANFFYKNKTIGWLISDGKILNRRDEHRIWKGNPKGTFIVYKDGRVEVGLKYDREMAAIADKIQFCCQGFNLNPLDIKKEGFNPAEVGRICNSVSIGYNQYTGKVIIAVRQGTGAERAGKTMLELGCSKSIRLDSGGSANLFVNGKGIFKTDRTLTNIINW